MQQCSFAVGCQDINGLKAMRLLTSWQKGARCTHLYDLNLPVVGISDKTSRAGHQKLDVQIAPRLLAVYSMTKTCKQLSF
jgi:hypothetical protein